MIDDASDGVDKTLMCGVLLFVATVACSWWLAPPMEGRTRWISELPLAAGAP